MFISSGLVVFFLSANLLITETRSVCRAATGAAAAAGGSNLKMFEKAWKKLKSENFKLFETQDLGLFYFKLLKIKPSVLNQGPGI